MGWVLDLLTVNTKTARLRLFEDGKSFAYDLNNTEQGIVSSRVALLLRSTEIQPMKFLRFDTKKWFFFWFPKRKKNWLYCLFSFFLKTSRKTSFFPHLLSPKIQKNPPQFPSSSNTHTQKKKKSNSLGFELAFEAQMFFNFFFSQVIFPGKENQKTHVETQFFGPLLRKGKKRKKERKRNGRERKG